MIDETTIAQNQKYKSQHESYEDRRNQWVKQDNSLTPSISLDGKPVTIDEIFRLLQKCHGADSQRELLSRCRKLVEVPVPESPTTSEALNPSDSDCNGTLCYSTDLQRKREQWENGGKKRLIDWRYDRDHSWRKKLQLELIFLLQQRISYVRTCSLLLHTSDDNTLTAVDRMSGLEFEAFCAEQREKLQLKLILLLQQRISCFRTNLLLHTSDNNPLTAIDRMSGLEFEVFCAELLKKVGFECINVTQASCDQGVDILAVRDDVKFAIQCKDYSSSVGNSAIQQVYAGKTFYHCHVAVVMTNSYFTESANELAKATGVILWNREKLKNFLLEIANKRNL